MPQPDYDYTQEGRVREYDGETPFGGSQDDSIGDFEIAEDVVAPEKSAEEFEQESGFRECPPGTYEFTVLGFLTKKGQAGPARETWKDAWYGDRKEGYKTFEVTVKLGLVDDPSCQVLDTFVLPPGNPEHLKHYYQGTPKQGGKASTKGFNSKKFFEFIERIGYPYPKGGKLPPEARKLANWVGRKVVATVITGDPYFDQATGTDKPGGSKVQLFSYRLAGTTLANYARAGQLAAKSKPKPAPAPAPAGLDAI